MVATTTYDGTLDSPSAQGRTTLRRIIAGAAPFDGVMGVACLAAAGTIGSWLGVSSTSVRVTGVVFVLAAAAGVVTLAQSARDVRGIVAANAGFAACCLGVLAFDRPNALGAVLLAGGAICSAGTAVAEHRLARS